MFRTEQTIAKLRTYYYRQFEEMRQSKDETFRNLDDPALKDEIDGLVTKRIREELNLLLRYPPQHVRHELKLSEFNAKFSNSFERMIFVMTKFPRGGARGDVQLRQVIDAVRGAVRTNGFQPLLASDHQFHPILWDNVELYLLACGKGIAIVEDRVRPELNPNVAIEWGFMRAMGKDVLFLMEEKFRHNRADWEGFNYIPFSWERPQQSVAAAVKHWLVGDTSAPATAGGPSDGEHRRTIPTKRHGPFPRRRGTATGEGDEQTRHAAGQDVTTTLKEVGKIRSWRRT